MGFQHTKPCPLYVVIHRSVKQNHQNIINTKSTLCLQTTTPIIMRKNLLHNQCHYYSICQYRVSILGYISCAPMFSHGALQRPNSWNFNQMKEDVNHKTIICHIDGIWRYAKVQWVDDLELNWILGSQDVLSLYCGAIKKNC